MKTPIIFTATLLLIMISLSSCKKLFELPPPRLDTSFTISTKVASGYYLWRANQPIEVFLGDTMRLTSAGIRSASYSWDFGDGTRLTTQDSIVYHVYTDRSLSSIYIKVKVTDSHGITDSSYDNVGVINPLTGFLRGRRCWSAAKLYFESNPQDSSILTISQNSPYVQVRYEQPTPRTFVIPAQRRTDSHSGLTYDISGQGRAYTIDGFLTYVIIHDTISYMGGAFGTSFYYYDCLDTLRPY